ncbi:hypothetical protein D3C73_693970 [compost metagenome]
MLATCACTDKPPQERTQAAAATLNSRGTGAAAAPAERVPSVTSKSPLTSAVDSSAGNPASESSPPVKLNSADIIPARSISSISTLKKTTRPPTTIMSCSEDWIAPFRSSPTPRPSRCLASAMERRAKRSLPAPSAPLGSCGTICGTDWGGPDGEFFGLP